MRLVASLCVNSSKNTGSNQDTDGESLSPHTCLHELSRDIRVSRGVARTLE
jgi:hypothetical protein